MGIKYWEFEDAPLKEKLKDANAGTIARIFFDSETEAYRFAVLLYQVKKNGHMTLKQVPASIPISTAKRYLDYAVQIGLLKHEDREYELTDRFTKPLRNIATYIKEWMDTQRDEDLAIEFPGARTERQNKRGGRQHADAAASGPNGDEALEEKAQDAD